MNKIVTNTGKEFRTDFLVDAPAPFLFVRILDTDLETARKVFRDPSETSKLQKGDKTYDGYTKTIAVFPEGDAVKIALTKE